VKINNSENVQTFIVDVEKRFPINEWKYNNIHVWPLIRISLEYFLYDQINTFATNKSDQLFFEEGRSKEGLFNKLKKQSTKLFSVFLFYYWYLKLKRNKDFLFLSATHYRSIVSNVSVNKFFDVLIEKYNLKSTSSYIEKPDIKHTGNVKYADININFYSGFTIKEP